MTPINMDTNAMKGRMERSTVSMVSRPAWEEGGHHPAHADADAGQQAVALLAQLLLLSLRRFCFAACFGWLGAFPAWACSWMLSGCTPET